MRARRFSTLVRQELATVLRSQFGIVAPNSVQADALRACLQGTSVLCVAQTGSGKTLVSLLPILERLGGSVGGTRRSQPDALMLAPSTVLAAQHASIAKRIAVALPDAPHVQTTLDEDAHHPHEEDSAPRARLLVATPQEALDRLRDGRLDLSRLCAVAVDEADAVLCSASPYEPQLCSDGAALLHAIETQTQHAPPTAPQFVLTTAMLTSAHEQCLLERFAGVHVALPWPPTSAPASNLSRLLQPSVRYSRSGRWCLLLGL
jgi:superfamily II DNA/RNA helicase